MDDILHLLRFNRQFASGVALLAVVAASPACRLSPYPPTKLRRAARHAHPPGPYPMGTTSRGQDLFWL